MKDKHIKAFLDVEKAAMDMLKTFPIDELTPDLRERAVKIVAEGHPSEYYAGMFHGFLIAIAKSIGTGKKKGLELGAELLLSPLVIGIAIRWHESCPTEVK